MFLYQFMIFIFLFFAHHFCPLQLLQRLLDDRRPTVEMIHAEGERIAATADPVDREKIETQLHNLAERWADLLDKAVAR